MQNTAEPQDSQLTENTHFLQNLKQDNPSSVTEKQIWMCAYKTNRTLFPTCKANAPLICLDRL